MPRVSRSGQEVADRTIFTRGPAPPDRVRFLLRSENRPQKGKENPNDNDESDNRGDPIPKNVRSWLGSVPLKIDLGFQSRHGDLRRVKIPVFRGVTIPSVRTLRSGQYSSVVFGNVRFLARKRTKMRHPRIEGALVIPLRKNDHVP